MLSRNARGVRRWIRLNLFDWWQVLGTIGLVLGALAFAMLLVNARELGRSTGQTTHDVQTSVSHPFPIDPSDEPSPAPAPAPVPQPASGQATPHPSGSRHLIHPATPVPDPSIIPTLVPSVSPTADATPTPTADATPTPSDTASPTPDPSAVSSLAWPIARRTSG